MSFMVGFCIRWIKVQFPLLNGGCESKPVTVSLSCRWLGSGDLVVSKFPRTVRNSTVIFLACKVLHSMHWTFTSLIYMGPIMGIIYHDMLRALLATTCGRTQLGPPCLGEVHGTWCVPQTRFSCVVLLRKCWIDGKRLCQIPIFPGNAHVNGEILLGKFSWAPPSATAVWYSMLYSRGESSLWYHSTVYDASYGSSVISLWDHGAYHIYDIIGVIWRMIS
jgi:hypothetical protein